MNVGGDPNLWSDLVPDRFIPDIIALVLEGWETFDKPGRDDLEVPITMRFCCCLRAHKNRSRLPFRIEYESPELRLESSTVVGRIDLRFCHGYREDVYFAFECKRLNVVDRAGKRRSLAGKYVEEGMMRFVEGKYAAGLDKGGMLGYVMDGATPSAVQAVEGAVARRRQQLRLTSADLERSSIRRDDARVRETRHGLHSGPFVVYHLFLSVGGGTGIRP